MTDTTISTDPATLRQAAYGIAQSYPAIADILYTIAAEKEAINEAIASRRYTLLTPEQSPAFAETLNNPPEPNEAMKAAAARYAEKEAQAAPATPPELWAMLYLHDWDLNGKVYPEIHAVYHTWYQAETARRSKSDPSGYHVRRVRFGGAMPHDDPSKMRDIRPGESLGGGLVAVPAPERPVIQCARCAGKGEFLDTTYDRTGEMVWCRPCHGTGKMLDDRDVKAALAALDALTKPQEAADA
jgi:hypothetical protein